MDYAKQKATAARLVTAFGQAATHTIRTAGSYNPATGGVTVTDTTQSVNVAVFDYGAKEIDGMIVVTGDKRALIAANITTSPKVDDTLTIGSTVWTMKNVKELNPAGTSLLFEAQIRK